MQNEQSSSNGLFQRLLSAKTEAGRAIRPAWPAKRALSCSAEAAGLTRL